MLLEHRIFTPRSGHGHCVECQSHGTPLSPCCVEMFLHIADVSAIITLQTMYRTVVICLCEMKPRFGQFLPLCHDKMHELYGIILQCASVRKKHTGLDKRTWYLIFVTIWNWFWTGTCSQFPLLLYSFILPLVEGSHIFKVSGHCQLSVSHFFCLPQPILNKLNYLKGEDDSTLVYILNTTFFWFVILVLLQIT